MIGTTIHELVAVTFTMEFVAMPNTQLPPIEILTVHIQRRVESSESSTINVILVLLPVSGRVIICGEAPIGWLKNSFQSLLSSEIFASKVQNTLTPFARGFEVQLSCTLSPGWKEAVVAPELGTITVKFEKSGVVLGPVGMGVLTTFTGYGIV